MVDLAVVQSVVVPLEVAPKEVDLVVVPLEVVP